VISLKFRVSVSFDDSEFGVRDNWQYTVYVPDDAYIVWYSYDVHVCSSLTFGYGGHGSMSAHHHHHAHHHQSTPSSVHPGRRTIAFVVVLIHFAPLAHQELKIHPSYTIHGDIMYIYHQFIQGTLCPMVSNTQL